ncbi:MAG: hypothetical protein F6K35_29415 [Okeania sp. SIO2H7]|nr:hypothetical protein [Okeania sp. SIO2H7]
MSERNSYPWVMRVELYLPTAEEMTDEMVEIAAAIAWANYRIEGKGCLLLQANLRSAPEYMYVPEARIQKSRPTQKPSHPDIDAYDPANEILLLVSPNWYVFPPELTADNNPSRNYRINVKKRVGKSCEECWLLRGERLGEVGREGTLMEEMEE